MKTEDQISDAIMMASIYHKDQVDKSGKPFILHVLRVGLAGQTPDEQQVGFLHDVVEDTDASLALLAAWGFSPEVVTAVDAITRRCSETYKAYLSRVKENPLALRVKLYDLKDNLDPARQDFEGAKSLQVRHQTAYDKLAPLVEQQIS